MDIKINLDDPDPVFLQLIKQVKTAVLGGHLASGDPLPSIRQLANDLELNHKTIAKAYRLLERDSIIQMRGYRGTFIHPEAKDHCKVDLPDLARRRLSETVDGLRRAGLTDSEIRIAFTSIMNQRQ